jgi:hypothetical protein
MDVSEQSQMDLGFLRSLEYAEDLAQVLRATQGYLNAWSGERVRRLQQADGGWAPFDQRQRPSTLNGVRDLQRVQNAVHRQCIQLRRIGIALSPELIELDEVLFVAVQAAKSLLSRESNALLPERGLAWQNAG